MPIEPISREWLFKRNSEPQIRRWATSLEYFRFCRAIGGHANDGDEFVVALRIDSEQDLLTVAEQLGCELVSLPPDVPRPEPGRAYRVEEFNRFPSPIDHLPQWEQPGSRSINGHSAFVWVKNGALEIHLSGANGDSYSVMRPISECQVDRGGSVPAAAEARHRPSDCNPALYLSEVLRRLLANLGRPPSNIALQRTALARRS